MENSKSYSIKHVELHWCMKTRRVHYSFLTRNMITELHQRRINAGHGKRASPHTLKCAPELIRGMSPRKSPLAFTPPPVLMRRRECRPNAVSCVFRRLDEYRYSGLNFV